ncbi:MAG: hypothetical protein WCA20_07310 [Candidatus Sulfotelmatobacter sp.]
MRSLDFVFLAQRAPVLPNHAHFFPTETCVFDRHAVERAFVLLVVGGEGVLVERHKFCVIRARFREFGKLLSDGRDQIGLQKKVVSGRAIRLSRGQQKLKEGYKKLLETTRRVVGQAKQVVQDIAQGVQPTAEKVARVVQRAKQDLEAMIPRVQQVLRQTRQRLFQGNTHAAEKIVSLFVPETEIIRKGKASKPTEFGKLVKIQEAENQIITHYEGFDQRPSDSHLLVPSIEQHQQQLGCTPKVVAADPGFFSAQNETAAAGLGVGLSDKYFFVRGC